MSAMTPSTTDALASPSWTAYWRESTRPLASLLFVMPILLLYEGGVLLLGDEAARNGIEVLLRYFLELLGFGQYFLLPLLTAAILLAWQHTSGRPWRLRPTLLPAMLLESMVLGLLLLTFARVQGELFALLSAGPSQAAGGIAATASRVVAYCGAGIYEELLFRLMLLPVVAGTIRLFGIPRPLNVLAALVITSFVFSAAHYEVFTTVGDAFTWSSFVFRALAGGFFSLLFIYRGFGIAVGAHALYDILAVVF